MSGSVSNEANAEPNLTPVLDMVFQLITFFMLVMNFKAASMDLSLKLPVVGSAKMVDTKGTVDLLVLNVDPEGRLRVYGQEKKDIQHYLQTEAMTKLVWSAFKVSGVEIGRRTAVDRRDSRRQGDAVQKKKRHHQYLPGIRLSQLCPQGDEQGRRGIAPANCLIRCLTQIKQ